jgi:hypothetical protein
MYDHILEIPNKSDGDCKLYIGMSENSIFYLTKLCIIKDSLRNDRASRNHFVVFYGFFITYIHQLS